MIVMDAPRTVQFRGRERQSAHLMSTLPGAEGTAELRAFGYRVGLRPSWLQHEGQPREHFDLFGAILKRVQAEGVPVISRAEVARLLRSKREAARPLLGVVHLEDRRHTRTRHAVRVVCGNLGPADTVTREHECVTCHACKEAHRG